MPRLPALAVIAVLACEARNVGTDTDDQTGSGSETKTDSETGLASDSDSGSETESETETETETDSDTEGPPPDLPPEPCEGNHECQFGQACIEGVCADVGEPAECAGPVAITLPQPSANGHVVAIDLVDFQQDGNVEILAWIDGVGIGVLDNGDWTMSEYLPEAQSAGTSIVAIHVDDDELLDVLVQDLGSVSSGLGDGVGGFAAFSMGLPVLSLLRGIEVAPDDRRAFGIVNQAAFHLSFDDIDQPTLVDVWTPARGFTPAQLDTDGSEDIVVRDYGDHQCRAHAMRLHPTDPPEMAEIILDLQNQMCWWLSADLDGDDRDELIAYERPSISSRILMSALANTTEPGVGPPSFAEPKLAEIPDQGPTDWVDATAGDFDGDGADELLFLRRGDTDATLVWASDEQLLGCMAQIPGFVDFVKDIRTGDLDGDGDDEVAMFRPNGELRVLDFQ
jgi:hypothetical protein